MNELVIRPRRRKAALVGRPLGALSRSASPKPVDDRQRAQRPVAVPAPDADGGELERLFVALGQVTPASNPRTFKLLEAGTRKVAQKVIEEAGEVALEAVKHRADGVVRESADLLYHLVVLWCRSGIEPAAVWQEMQARAALLGIAEKLPKAPRLQDQSDQFEP